MESPRFIISPAGRGRGPQGNFSPLLLASLSSPIVEGDDGDHVDEAASGGRAQRGHDQQFLSANFFVDSDLS